MLERNTAARVILRETSPRAEIKFFGLFQLAQISFEPWSFGKQPEDAFLIEDIHVVFPDHVVDRTQFLAIADQSRCETRPPVSHAATRQGMGTATANPDR